MQALRGPPDSDYEVRGATIVRTADEVNSDRRT